MWSLEGLLTAGFGEQRGPRKARCEEVTFWPPRRWLPYTLDIPAKLHRLFNNELHKLSQNQNVSFYNTEDESSDNITSLYVDNHVFLMSVY